VQGRVRVATMKLGQWYMVGGERTTCASTASSLNLRRANRLGVHSLTWSMAAKVKAINRLAY
jgi:hypothetical protein